MANNIDRQIEGWIDRQIYGLIWIDRCIDRQIDIQIDRWIERSMDRQIDQSVGRFINGMRDVMP